MPSPLPIASVNHVAVLTRNVPVSTAFYRDVLGFRSVARPQFDFDGAWLFNYGLMIHIIASEQGPAPGSAINTRASHLALHSDDMAAVENELRSRAIPYCKSRIADRGIDQIFFQDPDGNHIEVGHYPATPEFI